jgi:hypothetical protein
MVLYKLCQSFEEDIVKRVVGASQQSESLYIGAHNGERKQVNVLLLS